MTTFTRTTHTAPADPTSDEADTTVETLEIVGISESLYCNALGRSAKYGVRVTCGVSHCSFHDLDGETLDLGALGLNWHRDVRPPADVVAVVSDWEGVDA